MARKKRRRAKASEPAGGKAIAAYEHAERERANNPPVGLVTPETDPESPPGEYAFDPHLDPSLQWAGKAERTSFEVPTVSLHVHERLEPRTILEAVRRGAGGEESQPSLFHADERPIREAVEFYGHRDHWTNRLVAGDSLLVMQSLLAKDKLGGQVQMVYMDPPYGIRYGSNFQPFVGRPSATDGRGEDLTREPEQIRAFRDTWQLGIHSYLSYLRDRLLLARELLAESGSVFVQIGDENVHRAALVLDDIFGPENRVATITFATAGGSSTELLPEVGDYLLWYAKDKKAVKYRRPYEALSRAETIALFNWDAMVEEPDGTCRKLTDLEALAPDIHLPDDVRVYRRLPVSSQGASVTGRSEDYVWNGRTIPCPKNRHWCVSKDGMDRLAVLGRLDASGDGGWLCWKWYEDEVPGRRVHNIWHRRMQAQRKRFVVETAPSVIQRCLLMATDPGDLVFDPTCGSGTTAYTAEQWGRRWITCDTSRVALALARQRLVTSDFDYYRLARPEEGVSGGFVCRTVPKVSAASLAYDEPAQETVLHDQPEKESGKKRVAGPFTVEATPAPAVVPLTDETDRVAPGEADASVARSGATSRRGQWLEELARAGIRGRGGQRLRFGRLEPLPGHAWIHADGETAARDARPQGDLRTDEDTGLLAAEPTMTSFTEPRRVVVSFGPDFAPLDKKQVERALEEARRLVPRPKVLVFAAFAFDPEAAKDIDETRWAGVTLLKAEMNTDLQTEDLKKRQPNSESFWLVGQPDIAVERLTGQMSGGGGAASRLRDEIPRVGPGVRLLRHREGNGAVG